MSLVEPAFSSAEAKAALVDLLNALQGPANLPRLEAVRAEAGNDMVRQMQLVFPVVTQIQVGFQVLNTIFRRSLHCYYCGTVQMFNNALFARFRPK